MNAKPRKPDRWTAPIIAAAVLLALCKTSPIVAAEWNVDQRLIIACHRLDVDGVVEALRMGADVNARFGVRDKDVFRDPWFQGWSKISSHNWTPLIALANASRYPDPPREIRVEESDWAREQIANLPQEQLKQRERATREIALVLLSHGADIDAEDGHGATALYDAIDDQKLELATLLIRYGADVNTKTGLYIDGPGDITPLHEAYWSEELTKLLLEMGADPAAKDTWGQSAAERSRGYGTSELFRPNRASRRQTTKQP